MVCGAPGRLAFVTSVSFSGSVWLPVWCGPLPLALLPSHSAPHTHAPAGLLFHRASVRPSAVSWRLLSSYEGQLLVMISLFSLYLLFLHPTSFLNSVYPHICKKFSNCQKDPRWVSHSHLSSFRLLLTFIERAYVEYLEPRLCPGNSVGLWSSGCVWAEGILSLWYLCFSGWAA